MGFRYDKKGCSIRVEARDGGENYTTRMFERVDSAEKEDEDKDEGQEPPGNFLEVTCGSGSGTHGCKPVTRESLIGLDAPPSWVRSIGCKMTPSES